MFSRNNVLSSAQQEEISCYENQENGDTKKNDDQQEVWPFRVIVMANSRGGLCHTK